MLTWEEYKLCLEKCGCIFAKVAKSFFGNEYFCKKIIYKNLNFPLK